jgi:hypothetical protein
MPHDHQNTLLNRFEKSVLKLPLIDEIHSLLYHDVRCVRNFHSCQPQFPFPLIKTNKTNKDTKREVKKSLERRLQQVSAASRTELILSGGIGIIPAQTSRPAPRANRCFEIPVPTAANFRARGIPNVTVEQVAFLFRIWEVRGSNLSPQTDYPDLGLSWFCSAFTQDQNRSRSHSFTSFPVRFTIWCYITRASSE